ncbi:MAG: hypothetical protein LBK26_01580 [Rickettsiales bacterium]|jgi:hypothetical protein|nr:hypothetical protein [Rickettsiales bacterium]
MKKFPVYVLCPVIFLSACSTMGNRLDAARDGFASGDYSNKKIGDDNLDPLLAGNALFQQNKFKESDAAFEDINKRMSDAQSASVAGEVGKALSSQMAGNYKPFFMDDLFVSYYQIWDALADGRDKDARVIVNQSYAKQQKLSKEFASLISRRETGGNGLGAKLRSENSGWESYRDIMNPALTYLSGLYFLNFAAGASDFETARTYLSRASGMMPDNDYIKSDLAAAVSGKKPGGMAWIFIESGFAPKLDERRIDWPVIGANGVTSVSVAVSEPVMFVDMPTPDGARLLADVDAMFMTEFKEYSVNDALRALAGVAAKTAVQAVANNQLGPWGGFGAMIYSIASTGAEIRTWATLPKKIYLMRIDKTANSKERTENNEELILLKINGNVVSEIKVPVTGNDLIYIRLLNGKIEPKIIRI